MKRIISLTLALLMAVSLFACGEKDTGSLVGKVDKETGVLTLDPTEGDIKAELTAENADYSKQALETLKTGTHMVDDTDVPALYKYFEDRGVRIGVAFGADQIEEQTDPFKNSIKNGIIKHYNIYTLGNEFKPSYINTSEGVFQFERPDNFVKFGQDAGAYVRGHTLLWHAQIPDWWFKADPADTRSLKECETAGALATSEQLQERITTYITTVVTRYKDTVQIWDVCNEVLNADSIRRIADDSYWADIMGDLDGNGFYDDYVELAFNTARAADEDAFLMINDFNMEWQNTKTKAMYDMCERMMRKGVRIDGVGFQSHIGLDCNVELYRQNIEKIAGLAAIYDECFPEHKGEFRIQITELDMNMFVGKDADGGYKKWSPEEFEKQAVKYNELMKMFMDFVDRDLIDAIIFWGTDDENSWLNSTPKLRRNAALLVDRDNSLKPCFYSVAEAAFKD